MSIYDRFQRGVKIGSKKSEKIKIDWPNVGKIFHKNVQQGVDWQKNKVVQKIKKQLQKQLRTEGADDRQGLPIPQIPTQLTDLVQSVTSGGAFDAISGFVQANQVGKYGKFNIEN